MEDFIAAGDISDAARNRRGPMHVAAGGEFPEQLAIPARKAVEAAVVGTDQKPVARDHRRRPDFGLGLECPQALPAGCIHRVQDAVEIAHIDDALVDRRGRFADGIGGAVLPAQLPGGEV